MVIVKGEKTYTVTESATKWTVKTDSGKLELAFDVSKDICATIDELREYVTTNELIKGGGRLWQRKEKLKHLQRLKLDIIKKLMM